MRFNLLNWDSTWDSTLFNLHPNEYIKKFHYYPFSVKLDRCAESCNTVNDLSNKVYVPKKTEDLNLSIFSMITEINESKTLTKHISCICKFANVNVNLMKQNVSQINVGITINVDISVKNIMYVKKIMFGILLLGVVKMKIFSKYYW